jgi:hypothetical protein
MLPARESRTSNSLPVRIPPDALVYSSSNSAEELNGRRISVYESCVLLGDKSWTETSTGACSKALTFFERRRISDQGCKLRMDIAAVGFDGRDSHSIDHDYYIHAIIKQFISYSRNA